MSPFASLFRLSPPLKPTIGPSSRSLTHCIPLATLVPPRNTKALSKGSKK